MQNPNSSVVIKGRQRTASLFSSLLVGILGLFQAQTEAQVNVPSTFVLPSSAADVSKPGFVWRIHQVATAQPNDNNRSEAELGGLLGDNIANPSAQGIALAPAVPASPSTAPIQFEIATVINLSVFGGEFNGNFWPDDQMPGLPNASGGYENAAAEVLTWLDLPAGTLTLGVNSDDGFRMSLGGSNPKDQFAIMTGEFNGGRGPADTLFSVNVPQSGLYAMRCTWEQGCCGANIEIFSVDGFGNRVLLNDVASGGIKAYRAVTTPARAYARKVSPTPGTGSVRPDAPIVVELVDGASAINPATVKIAVDGAQVSFTRPKSGNVTTATYTPLSLYAPGSQHNVAFSYTESGLPVTVNWTFTVENYVGPNGNFYEFVYAPGISWEAAKAAAEQRTFCQQHGHLATITSAEEDVYLELLRQQYVASGAFTREAWVGGFQLRDQVSTGDGWMWVNGEGPIAGFNGGSTYAGWYFGEPNDATATPWEDNEENYLGIGLFGTLGWNDDDVSHNNVGGYVVEYDRLIVPIDIKPDGSPNPINLDAIGKLPVAILSTPAFDATTVDPSTVRFGRTGIEASPVKYSLEDVNKDGRRDLMCHFEIEDIGMMCGDVSAQLQATTFGGCPIKGSDSVQILHCPPYALSIQAMQDVHKVTDVYLKVNVILAGHVAPIVAQTIQLKSSDIFGHQKWTKNFQNTALSLNPDNSSAVSFHFPDMEHGQNVKAKMNVKEGGTGPTQVLRQEGRVLYRPDLAVMNVIAPSQANVRQIVNITTAVRELKGDLGATANVYLMDGNTVIDLRNGVSLAPLGDASVTFAAIFSTEGVHQLKVLIGDVTPGDYDLSNNERSFSILVIKPPLEPVSYYASYNYYDQDYQNVVENPFWINIYHDHYTNESTSETLYIPVAFQFPLSRVVLKIASDGVERNSFEILNIPQSYGYSSGCYTSATAFFYLNNNTYVTVQSDSDCFGYQQTYASFNRSAGGEVYFSAYFDKVYGGGYTNSYDYSSGTFLNPLNSVETRFVVEGDAGAFGGNGNVGTIYIAPLYGYEWDYFEYDYNNGLYDQHNTGFYRVNNVYGYNSGVTIP